MEKRPHDVEAQGPGRRPGTQLPQRQRPKALSLALGQAAARRPTRMVSQARKRLTALRPAVIAAATAAIGARLFSGGLGHFGHAANEFAVAVLAFVVFVVVLVLACVTCVVLVVRKSRGRAAHERFRERPVKNGTGCAHQPRHNLKKNVRVSRQQSKLAQQ